MGLGEEILRLREEIQQRVEENGNEPGGDWWADISSGKQKDWDAQPISPRKLLKGHFGKVYAMHWAGDSTKLVSASQDGKLIVWNAISTHKVQAIPLRSSWVMTCAFEQENNSMVACGGLDNLCSIYNVRGDAISVTRAEKELAAHDGYLSSCKFINQHRIVTCSGDSTCMLWDVDNGTMITSFNDHKGDVMSVAVDPMEPNTFVSGSTDSNAKVWDIRSGNCTMTFEGHESDINSVAFFPDGNAVGTGSDDSSCRLFDRRAYCEVNQFGDDKILCGITSVSFSKSGRVLFAGYDDYTCHGWNVTAQEGSAKSKKMKGHENRVSCMGVNNMGDALCTGSWDTLLKVWA